MSRRNTTLHYLKYWQRQLNLQDWNLQIEFVKFKRKDNFNQSGDIDVNLKTKQAVVKITHETTGKDKAIILHELLHLKLWEYDHFCELHLKPEFKDKYFELLEKVIANLTEFFLMRDN